MVAKRSITDLEISLIKAMIDRGMKNKDIQFFFNRPDRSVNSGRISNIHSGKYGSSKNILAASDAELDEFISNFQAEKFSATISVPAKKEEGIAAASPIDHALIASMFKKKTSGGWYFIFGESDRHECKEGFGLKHADKWLRAVAALANNAGGYVLFGVRDKYKKGNKVAPDSNKVIGLGDDSEFENADPADFTKRIKAPFDPTPRVETTLFEIDGLKIGVFYVHQHQSRPVIATKNEGNLVKEGDIYYRYSGQSARVKYSDLRSILDDRDKQSRLQILPLVQNLLDVGPQNAMVADLEAGTLLGGTHNIKISENVLGALRSAKNISHLDVKEENILHLSGSVEIEDVVGTKVIKSYVSPNDLIKDFLNGVSPSDPKEYIRCAVESVRSPWFPIHFYARKAGLDKEGLAVFIKELKGTKKHKQFYVDRALGLKNAYAKPVGQPVLFVSDLMSGKIPTFENNSEAANLGRALSGLQNKPPLEIEAIGDAVRNALSLIESSNRPEWATTIRKGIARLDELYFS